MPNTEVQRQAFLKKAPQKCKFGEECRFQTRCSYYHPKRCAESEAMEVIRLKKAIEHIKTEIQALKVENESKFNNLVNVRLTEVEGLQSQTLEVKKELARVHIYEDKCKELKDEHVKEVYEVKTLNEELNTEVAASELLNTALAKKKEELVQEIIIIVTKTNDQKGKFKLSMITY